MAASSLPTQPQLKRTGLKPVLPHEHGAWFILYCPLLLGYAVSGFRSSACMALLALAATGLFLLREPAELWMRGRKSRGTLLWGIVYLLLAAAGGIPLLLSRQNHGLLGTALTGMLLFLLHGRLAANRRQDRSLAGELVGTSALTLTAPAAYMVGTGSVSAAAAALWGACILFYSSSVFSVRLYLAAARAKKEWSPAVKQRIVRSSVFYHLLLSIALLAADTAMAIPAALWLSLAFLPAIVRGFATIQKLTPAVPVLKKVGMREAALSLWFTIAFTAGMHFL